MLLKGNEEANDLEKSRTFNTRRWKARRSPRPLKAWPKVLQGAHFFIVRKKFLTISRHHRKLSGKMCSYFFTGQGDRVMNDLCSWNRLWKTTNEKRTLCTCFLQQSWKTTTKVKALHNRTNNMTLNKVTSLPSVFCLRQWIITAPAPWDWFEG